MLNKTLSLEFISKPNSLCIYIPMPLGGISRKAHDLGGRRYVSSHECSRIVRDKKAHCPGQECQRSSVPEQVQMVSVVTDTLRIS